MNSTAQTIAGAALIAGLQEQGLIEGGQFRANREKCLDALRGQDAEAIGDRHQWVGEAAALLGFRGEACGVEHAGIAEGEELTVSALLYDEADRLERELGA